MQWRAIALLVSVAIASGLLSVFHMYLLFSRDHDSISVAVEIPLKAQHRHSTSLELSIQSVSHRDEQHTLRNKDPAQRAANRQPSDSGKHMLAGAGVNHSGLNEDAQHKSQPTVTGSRKDVVQSSSQASHAPPQQTVLGSYEEEGGLIGEDGMMRERVWGEDSVMRKEEWQEDKEDYTVLLDTGDYELEERDMDRTTDDPATPTPYTPHSFKGRNGRRRYQAMKQPHLTQSTDAQHIITKNSKPNNALSTAGTIRNTALSKQYPFKGGSDTRQHNVLGVQHVGSSGDVADTAANDKQNFQENERQNKDGEKAEKPKVFTMTREEYYARQATATYPHPTTHHRPHRTTASHDHSHTSKKCTALPCLQYLSLVEKKIFNKCQKRTVPNKSTRSIPGCQCRFMEGTGRKRVALVSLPGSGNTWVRGLLEKATGVCTGSIYCDRTLREGGFCGEGLRGSSLVAVKTHDSSLQWRGGTHVSDSSRPMFDKAIFLIRNPFRANIAEWNRQMSKKYASDQTGSSHVKYVSNKAFFGTQPGWQALVKYQTHKWHLMIGSNLKAHAGKPVLVVFFEDLKEAPAPQLARMLEFLEMPSSPDIISATLTDGYISYYRNHTDMFDHYTVEQKVFVNGIIARTADTLQGKEDIARRIREYLLHSSTSEI